MLILQVFLVKIFVRHGNFVCEFIAFEQLIFRNHTSMSKQIIILTKPLPNVTENQRRPNTRRPLKLSLEPFRVLQLLLFF